MRNTIKAKEGYICRKIRNKITSEERYVVYDGSKFVMEACSADYDTYLYNYSYNEEFCLFEVFTTVKGNQFIYWYDKETLEDFLTKVPNKK